MNNIMTFSDTHEKVPESLLGMGNPKPDMILHAGDFCDFSQYGEYFFEKCSELNIPTYFVSGNHETIKVCKSIENKFGAHYLDYSYKQVGNILLVGIGGYDIFSSLRKRNIMKFERLLNEGKFRGSSSFKILLTHEPPYPWKYDCKFRGNMKIAEIIKQYDFNLVLCGHWHEAKPRHERESFICPVINPTICGSIFNID